MVKVSVTNKKSFFKMDDERTAALAARAAMGYAVSGRRMHGADVAPLVHHAGYKMAQTAKYMQFARAGYNLGRRIVSSFSKSEKTMPALPVRRRLNYSTPTKSKTSGVKKTVNLGKSPGINVIRGGRYMKKRPRQQGAAYSKSAGFFKRPNRKKSKIDYYAKAGVVVCREQGGSIEGSAVNKFQSVGVMHANFGLSQILGDFCYALMKMVATKMGQTVVSLSDPLFPQTRSYRIEIFYKTAPTAVAASYSYTPSANESVLSVGNAFATQFATFAENPWFVFEWLVVYQIAVNTTPAIGTEAILRLNMQKATVKFYSKSALKLQNRTINSTGNVEGDDVDNVPLYGKQYDGRNNWFRPNSSSSYFRPLSTDTVCATSFGFDDTSALKEPMNNGYLIGVKKSGKAHLDPGQIKTSVIESTFKMPLNSLFRKIAYSFVNDNLVSLGKFRFYHFEKMIQAVATTDVNAIRLFYETDLKTGCIVTAPKAVNTTMFCTLNPL